MKRNIIYINLPLCLIIILSILNTNYALRPKVKQKQKSIDRVNMEGHISNEELYKRIQEYEQKFQDPTIATKFDQMIDDVKDLDIITIYIYIYIYIYIALGGTERKNTPEPNNDPPFALCGEDKQWGNNYTGFHLSPYR